MISWWNRELPWDTSFCTVQQMWSIAGFLKNFKNISAWHPCEFSVALQGTLVHNLGTIVPFFFFICQLNGENFEDLEDNEDKMEPESPSLRRRRGSRENHSTRKNCFGLWQKWDIVFLWTFHWFRMLFMKRLVYPGSYSVHIHEYH